MIVQLRSSFNLFQIGESFGRLGEPVLAVGTSYCPAYPVDQSNENAKNQHGEYMKSKCLF